MILNPEPNIPESTLPRVVIIGAGFAGINIVKCLRGQAFQVVLLDRNNYHLFQPLLYQVATAGLEPSSIAFPIRGIFPGQKNFYFRLAEVRGINPDRKVLDTSIGPLRFDYLVIATGSGSNYFGNPGFEQYGIGMKTLSEAVRIRNYILRLMEKVLLIPDEDQKKRELSFVIVGGGPTGVELAGALAEFREFILKRDYPELRKEWMRIALIEASPRLLASFREPSSQNAFGVLEHEGVRIYLDTHVRSYDGEKVLLSNGEEIHTHSFIWSAGVKGLPVEGLDPASLLPNGRYSVNAYGQVKGYEFIFALGDVACVTGEPLYPKGHPMLAQPAIQQGKLLAKNLVRQRSGRSMLPFSYKDKGNLATIGRNHAVAEIGRLTMKGFPAWIAWMFVHLIFLMGFRNKLVVFLNWVYGYFTYDRGTRIILKRDISDTRTMDRMVLEDKTKA